NVDSHDGSVRSKAPAIGTLEEACARARNIECGDDAFLIPQETVDRSGPVKVESCDLPTWADCEALRTLKGPRAGTRRVECGDGAYLGPDETVPRIGRVKAESYDRPGRVDVEGIGALKGPRARTRRVKGGNGLRRYCDGHCQGDQDGCRRHKLESQLSLYFHG